MAISRSARITILLVIDVLFFLIEIIVGYAVGSLALVADSFHMLNDILSLGVALYAIKLTSRVMPVDSNTRYSYGWHRAEILAALVNGVFLLALCFSIFLEAIQRFFSSPEVSNPKLVVIVGSLGLASNILGLFLFHEHDHSHDHGKSSDTSRVHGAASGDDQSEALESGDLTPSDGDNTPRGRSRERSDSLFGHPAATRAYVVQQAEELQRARSPSVPRGRTFSSSSVKSEHTRSIFSHGRVNSATETTPLKKGQVNGVPGTAQERNASEDSSSSESRSLDTVVYSHSKSHGHGHSGSMNMRALVLHVIGDALGNIGVIATGLIIWLSHLSWKNYFDPIISLVITCIIFSSALPLVKSASFILLQGVPHDISLQEVDEAIRDVEGVHGVHELHIWQLSESKVVASVHVHASRKHDFMKIAAEIRKVLHDRGIHSSTVQPEYYHPKQPQQPSAALPTDRDGQCLITCPPGQQDCDPAEHSCCPPPPPPSV